MTTSNPVLFDTNVLLYAQDKSSEFFAHAQRAHQLVIDGELEACVSLQNLMEFLSVVTNPKRVRRPLSHTVAIREAKKYLEESVFSVIYPSSSTIHHLQTLLGDWKKSDPRHIYDLQLVATMMSNEIATIVTVNVKDFCQLPNIEVLDLQEF